MNVKKKRTERNKNHKKKLYVSCVKQILLVPPLIHNNKNPKTAHKISQLADNTQQVKKKKIHKTRIDASLCLLSEREKAKENTNIAYILNIYTVIFMIRFAHTT